MRIRFARSRWTVLISALTLLSSFSVTAAAAATPTPIQVYGSWLCGNDECTWATVRNMTDFDTNNHWSIDRGDGSPSVNLVVLAFVNPLKLLDQTTDAGDANGVPVGMNSAVVSYFTSHGVRVMLSVGGVTYTSAWDTALTQNPTQLGINAAAVAKQLGVGIEIDYENSSSPNLTGLQSFVNAYRGQLPYDATGANPAARLTIDVAAGDQYLIALNRYATANWLTTANPVLDYANARWHRRNSPAACFSSAPRSNRNASVSPRPWRTPPAPSYGRWHPTALAARPACSATCSGPPSGRRPDP